MADNEKRIIDQTEVTTINNDDAFIMDSLARGTSQAKYTNVASAIESTLGIVDIRNKANGAMQKSVYDADNDGIVDNAEKVNNLTVETAVPPNAVFTDTVYDDTEVRTLIGQKLSIADYVNFTGATSDEAGTAGRVPAPGTVGMYLSSEGAWQAPDTEPTEDSNKLITSGAVKEALDNVEIDVDSALSPTSENPVQNKVVYAKMVSTAQADNTFHMGFYIDADGDLCQA